MTHFPVPTMRWWFVAVYVSVGWVVRAGMLPVILRRQFAPGASVAWLGIIFLHPYIGLTLYLLLGEKRLGPHRVERHRELVDHYRPALYDAEGEQHRAELDVEPPYEPMVLQAQKVSGMPVLCGNEVEFLDDARAMVDRLVADIDAAAAHVHLLYYLFAPDAVGRRVADALKRAAGRGVKCRVLADAVASRAFFHRCGLSAPLTAAGVQVAAAQPVAPIQRRMPRMDLRNHRKLAVIDGNVALAGSHNLIEPTYGGHRGAPWVDVTGRFTGPAVAELATVFAEDWAFETDEILDVEPVHSDRAASPEGADASVARGTAVQIVPTGPTAPDESYRQVLLAAVQSARTRLIITTPYFVPDEPTLVALTMASDRGVAVSLNVPETADQYLTPAAGRAHFARLMEAGVSIHLYRPGMLHSKVATVDDAFSVFGSANLDVRSFQLNFELTALLYGREATDRLRAIQEGYLRESTRIDAREWNSRSVVRRYADSAISLLSPLL